MRLDKFLCEVHIGSRSQVKTYLKQGLVTVNGVVEKQADRKIAEEQDVIAYKGNICTYEKFGYFMLHKPAGVVSATEDRREKTVMDLLKDTGWKDLFPVGRLDKDTEGLLLITNDGALAHHLLSPRKHVAKTYVVKIEHALSEEDILQLEQGLDIGDEKITLPANVQVVDALTILLTITEGRFHQIKRMLQAVHNQVCYLKRVSMGPLVLDDMLQAGEFRPLTKQEVEQLKGAMKC